MILTNYINKSKNKNHIIISIGVEKAFNKIQHPFMIKKNSPESGHRGNTPQHYKGHTKKPTANILSGEKLK